MQILFFREFTHKKVNTWEIFAQLSYFSSSSSLVSTIIVLERDISKQTGCWDLFTRLWLTMYPRPFKSGVRSTWLYYVLHGSQTTKQMFFFCYVFECNVSVQCNGFEVCFQRNRAFLTHFVLFECVSPMVRRRIRRRPPAWF